MFQILVHLRFKVPEIQVIAFAFTCDENLVFQVIERGLGIAGYLNEHSTDEDIAGTIRLVASGKIVLPSYVNKLMTSKSACQPDKLIQRFPKFTQREAEIVVLLAEMRSNEEIARALSLNTTLSN